MKLKLEYTKMLIHCWVESWGVENVYVAYSGGKDSEVLLHIAIGAGEVLGFMGLEY